MGFGTAGLGLGQAFGYRPTDISGGTFGAPEAAQLICLHIKQVLQILQFVKLVNKADYR
jgi:hypothetical protein